MADDKTKQISTLVQNWISTNRHSLPINIDSWKIQVRFTNRDSTNPSKPKPRADATPFYKSISRIIPEKK